MKCVATLIPILASFLSHRLAAAVLPHVEGEYLQNDAFYTYSYYRTLIGNHRQAIE